MISVCMATFNGERYIAEQIESILTQLGPDDELIISDDGSTDKTLDIIRGFNNRRIKIVPLDGSKSQVLENAFNKEFSLIQRISLNFLNALSYAEGDTIYLADQDDVWKCNKIAICEERLRDNMITIHRRIDVDGDLAPLKKNNTSYQENRKASLLQSLKVSHFQGACMAFRKEILQQIKKNFDLFKSCPISHDHSIGYIAMAYFGRSKIDFNPKQLILYRRHGSNVSPTGEKSKHSLMFKLLYRWYDIKFYGSLQWRKRISSISF